MEQLLSTKSKKPMGKQLLAVNTQVVRKGMTVLHGIPVGTLEEYRKIGSAQHWSRKN
jgi:hypothetical protein